MTIEQIAYITLAATIGLLNGVVIFLIIAYMKLLKNATLLEKAKDEREEHIRKRAAALLSDAHDKALVIIEQANLRAAQTLEETNTFSQTAKHELEAKLSQASAQLLTDYERALEEVKEEDIKTLKNISKTIESNTLDEVADFKEILEKETVAAQKIVEQKIEQAYADVEQEIKAYREDKRKKIDEAVYTIVRQVSEEILGKSVSLADHEKLVIDALEQAKADFARRT